MKKHFVILAAFLALVCSVEGNDVIDSFNNIPSGTTDQSRTYTLPSGTLGSGQGGIGFTDKYQQNTAVSVVWTNDLVVALTNYVSGQSNSAAHWSVGAQLGTAVTRTQTRPTVSLSGTIWFSFIANLYVPNGDVALVINPTGLDGLGGVTASSAGMRIGVGSTTTTLKGAIGVGPFGRGNTTPATLSYITNGVNGAVSTNNVAPTNGIAGLMLGKIYTDPDNGYRRIDIWYNPDVTNQNDLPAPKVTFTDTNGVLIPSSVTMIGYQATRGVTIAEELIDVVKLSDETNAFDIVYLNAALPITTLSAQVKNVFGTAVGPTYGVQTNIIFNVVSDRVVVAPASVIYKLSGTAVYGIDYTNSDASFDTNTMTGALTLSAGQTNVILTVYPRNSGVPNGDLTVTMAIQNGTGYIPGSQSSTSGTILAQNYAGVTVQYMFTGTLAPNVFDTNLIASAADVSGLGGNANFSGVYFISPPLSYNASGSVTTNSEAGAVANGNYMGIPIAPVVGAGMTLTNLKFDAVYGDYQNVQAGAVSAGIAVRSSLDNFTSDLTNLVLFSDEILFPADIWYHLDIPLGSNFSNLIGQVEFRVYVYDDSSFNLCGVRIDNLYLKGSTFNVPSNTERVSVTTVVTNASVLTSTSGKFNITRIGDTTSALTVFYNLAGSASNGLEYVFLPGSATIPAGQTNVFVTVTPLDDGQPEPAKNVVLTLANNLNYGILPPSSAIVNLAANGDIPGLVIYYFNENNNLVSSLADVAVPALAPSASSKITASNAVAGPGLGSFGAGASGHGNGYASGSFYSAPSTIYAWSGVLTNNEADAVSLGDYFSFSLQPQSSYSLTLTNFIAYLYASSSSGYTYFAALRSSLDNYTTDIASLTVVAGTSGVFQPWSVPLNVSSNLTGVTFRFYIYGSTPSANDYFRVDDVTFQGSMGAVPMVPHLTNISIVGTNITINFTGDSSLAASAFKLQSATDVVGPYIDDNTAIVTGSGGVFQVTAAMNGPSRFYRIRY